MFFFFGFFRFSHLINRSSIKCHDSRIIVDNDSMELQPNKSSIDNENKLAMF